MVEAVAQVIIGYILLAFIFLFVIPTIKCPRYWKVNLDLFLISFFAVAIPATYLAWMVL